MKNTRDKAMKTIKEECCSTFARGSFKSKKDSSVKDLKRVFVVSKSLEIKLEIVFPFTQRVSENSANNINQFNTSKTLSGNFSAAAPFAMH